MFFSSYSLTHTHTHTHKNRTVENGQKTVIKLENGKLVSKTVNGVEALEDGGASPAGAIDSGKTKKKRKHH